MQSVPGAAPPRRGPDADTPDLADADEFLNQAERDATKIAPNYRNTKLANGTVVTVYLEEVLVRNVGGCEKWLARMVIADGPNEGLPILRSWNIPRRGWISPQHHLAQDWLALPGRPVPPMPKAAEDTDSKGKKLSQKGRRAHEQRRARSVLHALLRGSGGVVLVEARTHLVKKRMDRRARKWVDIPESAHYSVRDKLVKLGTPRCLELRQK